MERLQIEFPKNILFTTHLVVRITDLNYGGHLANDKVLSLAHEARVRFLESLGYTEFDLEGVGIIMADAAIQFKSEAFAGSNIQVDIAVPETSKVGFSMYYRMHIDGKEVALIRTNLVCFDYKIRKIASLPVKALAHWI